MKWTRIGIVPILAATIVGIGLRLPELEQRPMHGDEAVHAIKFGSLLEDGRYRYDPHEYHGPTLNYLSLVPAWISSSKTLADVSESTLRLVPVFFGVLLVVLPWFLMNGLGYPGAIMAASLTAVSPAMVFYSRYYIQEMLLVCFALGTIVSGYQYLQNRRLKWMLLTGLFLGLMHATKETSILLTGSMALSLIVLLTVHDRQGKPRSIFRTVKNAITPWHGVLGIAVMLVVVFLFYSSFFTHLPGMVDSVRAYGIYIKRASQTELHVHPWYYYLKMFIFSQYAGGPIWSEAFIIILAIMGLAASVSRKGPGTHLIRFLAVYTIILTVITSLIPYKTPWVFLGPFHGMILLAGIGAVTIVRLQPKTAVRALVILLLATGGAHLGWQAYHANFKYYADPVNPYVYAHPTSDVIDIARRVRDISEAHPHKNNMYVQVIFPGDDYWPLPWYLRDFPNVGWWNRVDADVQMAQVIIASPSFETAVIEKLYEDPPPGKRNLYVPLFSSYTELRPGVELRGYITKELWDRFQQHKGKSL